MGYLQPDFPKPRMHFGKLRKGFGPSSEIFEKARKKRGGVGGGRTKKIRVGWVGDDVIEKNKKIKNKK